MKAIKPKKTLVEQTYEILLDAICTGELAPGERLTQDQIAARLNVSRQPVNSAISILKANNFVEDAGRRGVVVSAVDSELFRSVFEYRSVIEPFAVTLAGGRLPKEAKGEAERILAIGRRAAAEGDIRILIQADVDFHEMIYRWSGNHVIQNSMRVNWHHMRRSIAEALREPGVASLLWDEHARIVEGLLDGRTHEAAARMRDHIVTAYQRILRPEPERALADSGAA